MLKIRFASSIQDLRKFRVKKIFVAIILLFKLIWALITFRPKAVYFSFMPVGYGFWRDSLFLMIIKLFCSIPILHLDNQGISNKAKNSFYRSFYRFIFRGCKIIHVNRWLLEKEIIPLNLVNSNLYFVHNTIEKIPEVEVAPKKQILFLSNLFPIKGAPVLIRAFSLITSNYPDYKLIIAGEAPGKSIEIKLNRLIQSLGLQKKVILTGGVNAQQKAELISQSEVFILPSLTDCFPLVILEAMHFGIPVITTKVGGLHTLFKENEEMVFIDHINPAELSEKIIKLLSNKDLREFIGENGRKRSAEVSGSFEVEMQQIIHSALL